MGGVRPRRAGQACATCPFRVADDSILVEGVDVAGEAGHAAASCRVYRGERGLSGVPSAESIAVAIADIKVASLWRARVRRNGGNRTTGNRLVPFCNNGG
jgi:hypothetical protein